MDNPKSIYSRFCALSLASTFCVMLLVGCGGGNNQGAFTPSTGTVNTSISDPPICGISFSHVWVTVTKVRANVNSNAAPNDSGWVDLVNLSNSPKQVDLLSLAQTTCLATQLGAASLPMGKYQQIRFHLLANNATGVSVTALGSTTPTNSCGPNATTGPFNCVVPKLANGQDGQPQTLNLSSEAQTGIKIPGSQISQGGFTVSAGQVTDLDIDFNTCESLVAQGNGQFRLKPVLHAGEVSPNTNTISGKVVDSANTSKAIGGALVFLEQPDSNNANLDRVFAGVTAGSDGSFSFGCLPVGGSFDVVAAGMVTDPVSKLTTTYNATVTLKVPVGTAMGNIPVVAEPTTVGTVSGLPSSPATFEGLLTTSTAATGGAATSADISLSALQPIGGGSSLLVTVPPFPTSTPNVATKSAPKNNFMGSATSCSTGTDCENFILLVPASNPKVGTFASSGTIYAAPATNPAIYWINARAFVPMTSSTNPGDPDCSPSSFPATFDSSTQKTVNPGDPPVSLNFTFTGCQSGL